MPGNGPVDLPGLLKSARRRAGDRTAVLCGAARLTYAGLDSLAARCAEALARHGAEPGDRVAALLPNCHLYMASYFGALAGRFVLVPINPRLHPEEIRAILEHSGARVLIGEPRGLARVLGERVGEADGEWAFGRLKPPGDGGVPRPKDRRPGSRPPEAPDPDAAQIYYTSGTTGKPKGVVLTRGNLAAHATMTVRELGLREADVWLHAAPMFHLADAWAVWAITAAAGTHVMLPRFEPEAALERIASARVTITNLVPAMLLGLLDTAERRGERLPSLRLLLSGGAPIAPRTVARIEHLLDCDYAQTYGLTETSPFLTFSLLDEGLLRLPREERDRLRARTGRPARGVDLRVVRPPGAARFEDVPADDETVGEVIVRGPTVTPGYWRDPEETRRAFLGGWFHTGDLGTLDRHGFLNLVDRAKDVIITGGENVYSTEVENALYEHPAVLEAAVFGVPDATWGESVRAAIVLRRPGAATIADLVAFCRQRIARFKCPRAVDLVEALPRTGSGKIDKKALREPFWRGRERRIH